MTNSYPYFGALPCRERDEEERKLVAARFRDANCETILTEDSDAAIIALANYRRIRFFFKCEPWEIFPHAEEAIIPRFSAPLLKSLAQLSELMPGHTSSTLTQLVLEKHKERTIKTGAQKVKVRERPGNENNKWAHSAPRGGITTGDINAAVASLQRLNREKETAHNQEVVENCRNRSSARRRSLPVATQASKRTGDVAETPVTKRRRHESVDIELRRTGVTRQGAVSPLISPERINTGSSTSTPTRYSQDENTGVQQEFLDFEESPFTDEPATNPITDHTTSTTDPPQTTPSFRLSGSGVNRDPLISNLAVTTSASNHSRGGSTPARRTQTAAKPTNKSRSNRPTRSRLLEEDSGSTSDSEDSDSEQRHQRNKGRRNMEQAKNLTIAARCAQYQAEMDQIRAGVRKILAESQTPALEEPRDLILHAREAQLRITTAIIDGFPALKPRIITVESHLEELLSRAQKVKQDAADAIDTAQDERAAIDSDLQATLQSRVAQALANNDQQALKKFFAFQTDPAEAQEFIDRITRRKRQGLQELDSKLAQLDTDQIKAASDESTVINLVDQITVIKRYVEDALLLAEKDKAYHESNPWHHRGI